jgi:hypothetical protein
MTSPKTVQAVLDHTLISLTGVDVIKARDGVEGMLITGSPGSGKSSTAFKQMALAMLKAGYGGLVLSSKREEPELWMKYAEICGRREDVIRFSPEGDQCFDPLFHVFNMPGRGAGDVESVISGINALLAIGHPNSGGGSSDRFWELETERAMRATIKAMYIAREPISIVTMNNFIQSLPTEKDQHKDAEWQNHSYCGEVLMKIRLRNDAGGFSPDEADDVDMVLWFICNKWPGLHERERGIVAATWYGMADRFLYQPYKRLFSNGICTFVPEMCTHEGKIIICDFPVLETGQETSRFVNCMVKLFFEQAWLRRDFQKIPNVTFLAADEMQMFILPKGKDNFFSQACRSAGIIVLGATQNLSQIAEEFGEHHIGPKTKAWLGNLGVKIAFQQNDTDTNIYFAELVGKEYRTLRTISESSVSFSEQLQYKVEPDEWAGLRKPDGNYPIAEAIVHHGGKRFTATRSDDYPKGLNYLRIGFTR